jgi:hypothetical protein
MLRGRRCRVRRIDARAFAHGQASVKAIAAPLNFRFHSGKKKGRLPGPSSWRIAAPLSLVVRDQHLPSLQSPALSSTFSPTFCTSLPAPAMVLQPDSMPIENIEITINANKRFISTPPDDWLHARRSIEIRMEALDTN